MIMFAVRVFALCVRASGQLPCCPPAQMLSFRALKLYLPTMPLRRRRWYLTVAAGWFLSLLALASRGSITWLSHALGAPPAPPQQHRPRCSNPGVPAFMARCPTKGLSTSSCLDRYRLRRDQGTAPMETCWRGSRERLRTVMQARAGEGGWSGTPRNKRPLVFLAEAVNAAVLEMCVENKGRPLAMGMTDLVEHAIEAFASGYSLEALLLELQLLDSTTHVPGETLTGVEKRYRTQWIGALHAVMQNLNFVDQREPQSPEEFHLKSQVDVVLRGRQTNDEQTFVKFDKALATGGISGGVATERIVIAPQMVPISQLVLLGIRALQKLEDAA